MVVTDPALDAELRKQLDGKYKASELTDNTIWVLAVYLLVTVLLFAGLWLMFRRARDSIFSGGMMGGFGWQNQQTNP